MSFVAELRVKDDSVTAHNQVFNAMGMEGGQKVFVVLVHPAPSRDYSDYTSVLDLSTVFALAVDISLYFYNNRKMKRSNPQSDLAKPAECVHPAQRVVHGVYHRPSFVDSVLTDAVLCELKKQSVNGCLLCSFDAWDGEEWD
ncbi:MAG: hypothetical protein M3Y72_00735 [Acidobacteriota bacterium]|nr:hypothetical protein [Acidobacteriota bacterium]